MGGSIERVLTSVRWQEELSQNRRVWIGSSEFNLQVAIDFGQHSFSHFSCSIEQVFFGGAQFVQAFLSKRVAAASNSATSFSGLLGLARRTFFSIKSPR